MKVSFHEEDRRVLRAGDTELVRSMVISALKRQLSCNWLTLALEEELLSRSRENVDCIVSPVCLD